MLRPLANLKYIEEYGKMPYTEYFRTFAEIEIDKSVNSEIAILFELKKSVNDSYTIPANTILTDYFTE